MFCCENDFVPFFNLVNVLFLGLDKYHMIEQDQGQGVEGLLGGGRG